MSTVRTQAGRTFVEAAETLGYGAYDAARFAGLGEEFADAVAAIEAEARRDAFAAIETAVTERMHGGVWLSEAAVLDLVKNAREGGDDR